MDLIIPSCIGVLTLCAIIWSFTSHNWSRIVNVFSPILVVLLVAGAGLFLFFGFWYLYAAVALYVTIVLVQVTIFNSTPITRTERLQFLVFLFIVTAAIVFIFLGLRRHDNRSTAEKPSPKTVSAYFESIRDNEAALTTFFQAMPKGGDLHNHYGGSVYAESFLDLAIANKLWIHPQTLKMDTSQKTKEYLSLEVIQHTDSFGLLRQRIYQDWSIRDFYDGFRGADQHFFDSFKKFPKERTMEDSRKGLQELLDRAATENVQYLELMVSGPNYEIDKSDYAARFVRKDTSIRMAMKRGNIDTVEATLEEWFQEFSTKGKVNVDNHLKATAALYRLLKTDQCAVRFMAQGRRELRPADVFRGLVLGFMAADKDSLIVGVNIVNREDGPISMRDYRLHMEMFRFLHNKFKAVKYAMHAGELVLGVVRPEDLTWHIHDALFVAGAQRIGHGVDLPHETEHQKILDHMREKKVPVEINLTSNEFILKSSHDRHPIMQYFLAGAPIVISTDDLGILRSNMTHQFVLLALRYKQIAYDDIKEFIRNSLRYSFIKDAALKQRLMDDFEDRVSDFERKMSKP